MYSYKHCVLIVSSGITSKVPKLKATSRFVFIKMKNIQIKMYA